MHGAVVVVRRNPSRHDLDEHRVDAPQILDVVDDVAGCNEAVEPVDHAAVRDAEHPREVVHAQCEEAGPLPQGFRKEEEQRFVSPHAIHDDEERGEVGAHGRDTLGRLRSRRHEPQARVVRKRVVRTREPTAARIRREQVHW